MEKQKENYEKPCSKVFEFQFQGIICESPTESVVDESESGWD